MPRRRIAVIGAGAAGSMAAIFAAAAGADTVLLERTRDGGRKILISGGGRCNILPSRVDETRFVTDSSPHTLRKILLSWPLAEQRRFFEEEAGVALALEAESGKLFPASNSAREVRDKLIALADRRGVERRFGALVTGLKPGLKPGLEPDGERRWTVLLEDGSAIAARSVIVASGTPSIPPIPP